MAKKIVKMRSGEDSSAFFMVDTRDDYIGQSVPHFFMEAAEGPYVDRCGDNYVVWLYMFHGYEEFAHPEEEMILYKVTMGPEIVKVEDLGTISDTQPGSIIDIAGLRKAEKRPT